MSFRYYMFKQKFAVTTARNVKGKLIEAAKAWAEELHVPYVARHKNETLEELLAEHELDAFIIAKVKGAEVYSAAGNFGYHPNMAALRILEMQRGAQDNYVEALGLHAGSRVLDCTLGLAADAAVASYVVGATGRVVGVEASPLVHFAVQYGLAHYVTKYPWFDEALRRIETFNAVADDYLQQLISTRTTEADLFDVVYFDPMFHHGVKGSLAMDALRPISYEKPLEEATIQLALQIAPKVVIKERSEFHLQEYGCEEFFGGKSSRVKFGFRYRK